MDENLFVEVIPANLSGCVWTRGVCLRPRGVNSLVRRLCECGRGSPGHLMETLSGRLQLHVSGAAGERGEFKGDPTSHPDLDSPPFLPSSSSGYPPLTDSQACLSKSSLLTTTQSFVE